MTRAINLNHDSALGNVRHVLWAIKEHRTRAILRGDERQCSILFVLDTVRGDCIVDDGISGDWIEPRRPEKPRVIAWKAEERLGARSRKPPRVEKPVCPQKCDRVQIMPGDITVIMPVIYVLHTRIPRPAPSVPLNPPCGEIPRSNAFEQTRSSRMHDPGCTSSTLLDRQRSPSRGFDGFLIVGCGWEEETKSQLLRQEVDVGTRPFGLGSIAKAYKKVVMRDSSLGSTIRPIR